MREILFRGKRDDNGEWVVGNLFIPDIKDTPTQICIGTHIIRITYNVIPETVGQYTGLTDKNGKKIFEGDIIIESDGGMDGIPRMVIWDEVWMQYECPLVRSHWAYGRNSGRLWLMRDKDVEVIGNIHDNPELLKGGGQE